MERLSDWLPAGPPIREDQQIGRGATIADVTARLRQAEVLKLLEPRRVGKTSVARAALDRIATEGGICAEVNLAERRTPEATAEALAKRLAPGLVDAARGGMGGVVGRLSRARPEQALGPEPSFIIRLVAELVHEAPDITLVLERARRRIPDVPFAVLLDEAHVLADWPGAESLGAALRDNAHAIGAVIASSEARALERLTADDGPLRFVGQRFPLSPIARADWEHELAQRFARLDVPIEPTALALLLDESTGHPYCTMLLAREAARVADEVGRTTEAAVRAALLTVAQDEAWQRLR